MMQASIAKTILMPFASLEDRAPTYALVGAVDLVVVREDDKAHVLFGRCLHRGALLADGFVRGQNLICPLHNWDYRLDSGVSAYDNGHALKRFTSWIENGEVVVDAGEIAEWARAHPQPYQRNAYLGLYADPHGTPEEPHVRQIQSYARSGLEKTGHHGIVDAMGVPRQQLPDWDDIQILTAQLHRPPLLDDAAVDTRVVIGPNSRRPLQLSIPILISDMSFGSLSASAKVALAMGAELAGTAICSGEGGMLAAEQKACSHYVYELASARFGFSWDKVALAQAFHFKGGQAAKTGTGGHLPGAKVTAEIAAVRGLRPGEDAISPSRFPDLTAPAHFRAVACEVRERTGGIPIGFKLSAQHIEKDVDAALEIGVDYIILDGRGGGTGAAPLLFRDNISVPTIPALARARRHLERCGRKDVTLIITGGLRTPADFIKALALGADAVAISNAAMMAIGCIAMRACHTNSCPVGIATQKPNLVARLAVEKSARQLANFLGASAELIRVMARACGHDNVKDFSIDDLVTFKPEMAQLAGIAFAGIGPA